MDIRHKCDESVRVATQQAATHEREDALRLSSSRPNAVDGIPPYHYTQVNQSQSAQEYGPITQVQDHMNCSNLGSHQATKSIIYRKGAGEQHNATIDIIFHLTLPRLKMV